MSNPESETAALLKRCEDTFEAKGHDEWRNEVALDLNLILGRVEYTLETSDPGNEAMEVDIELAKAALRIVDRVANFEDIARV